jgi:hypothetical protein
VNWPLEHVARRIWNTGVYREKFIGEAKAEEEEEEKERRKIRNI